MAVNDRTAPAPAPAAAADIATSATTAYVFAGLRLLMGFIFLWTFFDDLFGLGYPEQSGWFKGESPTKGFLSHVAAGPMESTLHAWAGAAWVDWLFILAMLGIGLALAAGIALRLTAVAGTAMLAMMWIAVWPPAMHLFNGAPSGSANPFADYHVVYAVVLIALAAAGAGGTWGLGQAWARLPFVSRNPWLL